MGYVERKEVKYLAYRITGTDLIFLLILFLFIFSNQIRMIKFGLNVFHPFKHASIDVLGVLI